MSLRIIAYVLIACIGVGAAAAELSITSASDSPEDAAAAISGLADELLQHLESTDVSIRQQRHLPFDRVPDFSFAAAQRQAAFSRQLLERLNRIPLQSVSHDRQLLAGILRQSLQAGATADEDYWYQFLVTPYAGGMPLQQLHQQLAAASVASSANRDQYVSVLNQYADMVDSIREKTLAQARRGIRVSRQALPGVMHTLQGLRDSIGPTTESALDKASDTTSSAGAEFKASVRRVVGEKITPAYDSLLAIFDAAYASSAPAGVGLDQYAGGKQAYRRRIFIETGLTLEPRAIHEMGLQRVAELELQLKQIREETGFKGDKRAFHAMLRSDPRFIAKTPQDVEARYLQHLARIAPLLPQYFAVLPGAPYGVKRLAPAAEAGMTYGYYDPPNMQEARGLYYFNGSDLTKRSLVTSAHLIYHELLPGHHLRMSLALENTTLHPLLSVMSFGAYEEGWAEYAANLAVEMGAMPDPFDRYGHYVLQMFLASRLVVDTGMNYFGWSRARAIRFMLDHTFESDTQLSTETLRYSTDIPAQALDYRLGYETIVRGRARAQHALGPRFDIRSFDTALSNHGAMPLNVLDQQIEWYISHPEG